MASVNWNLPTTGLVNDPNPSLRLRNIKGRALVAESQDVAVTAVSKVHQAIVAQTDNALTGRFASRKQVAVLGDGPEAIGVIGSNQNGFLPIGAINQKDPTAATNFGGIGVLGGSTRLAATGVAGITLGPRSTRHSFRVARQPI